MLFQKNKVKIKIKTCRGRRDVAFNVILVALHKNYLFSVLI